LAAQSSPTVRRRQLAAELRRLRQAARLTIEQVAEALEWSAGKISRIENAKNSVNARDTRHLLDLYQVGEGPEREALLGLARQSRERGWWQRYGEAVPEWFSTYVGLEAEAASIAAYQGETVPGLLQTAPYALDVHRAAMMNADPADIERQVDIRMERQARLTQPNAPQLWVVLNEAVIKRIVGSRQTMYEQLTKLIEISAAPNVSIQVLPFAAGAHAAMDSAFSLLEFEAPTSSVVYLEHQAGALYLEQPAEVSRYRLVFDHLRAVSLSFDDSARLLRRAADDLS
jgi:transcriptional regulator with XRE-family HTH domain